MKNDFAYDEETMPNVFTIAFEHCWMPFKWAFEISPWRNDSREIIGFVRWIASNGGRLVGYNNLGFDYPILHTLMKMGHADAPTLYAKAMAIIGSRDDDDEGNKFMHMVYRDDRIVEQIDLFKIHHFDNRARRTSLKALEFVMKSDHVEDMPIPVGTIITREQLPILKSYNAHDVSETKKFYHHSLDAIRFREELLAEHPGKDWLSFSDVKIGVEFFLGGWRPPACSATPTAPRVASPGRPGAPASHCERPSCRGSGSRTPSSTACTSGCWRRRSPRRRACSRACRLRWAASTSCSAWAASTHRWRTRSSAPTPRTTSWTSTWRATTPARPSRRGSSQRTTPRCSAPSTRA